MKSPIIIHGNGQDKQAPTKTYRQIMAWLENSRADRSPIPSNLKIVTWNTTDRPGDLEYSLFTQNPIENCAAKNPVVRLGKRDDWIEKNLFIDYNPDRGLIVFGQPDDSWLKTGQLKELKPWYNCNKIVYLKRWLDTADLNGIDYVLVADSFDVMVVGDLAAMIERFKTMGCEILFNAETNCFSTKKFMFQEDQIAEAEGANKKLYPNSGAYLATTVELCRWVNWAFAEAQRMFYEDRHFSTDDQITVHKYYVENYPRVKIDLHEQIFQCLFQNTEKVVMPDGTTFSEPVNRLKRLDHHFKLAIGVPMLFPFIPVEFWQSFMAIEKPNDTITISMPGSLTAIARNDIVKTAIQNDCTHLMFLDSDMVFPPYVIKALLALDADIAAAPYQERYRPYRPVLMNQCGGFGEYCIVDPLPHRVCKVDAVGTGAMLIRLEVFEKLEFPWFDYRIAVKDRQRLDMVVEGESKHWTEDIYLCEKARRAGYEIVVDTSLECGHIINDRIITMRDWSVEK